MSSVDDNDRPTWLRYAASFVERVRRIHHEQGIKNWTFYVYHDDVVDISLISSELDQVVKVVYIPMGASNGHSGLFWRYLIHDRNEVCRYMVLAIDRYPTKFTTDLLQQWTEGIEDMSVMVAYTDFTVNDDLTINPVMSGFWSLDKQRGNHSFCMSKLIDDYRGDRLTYADSVTFFSDAIWPLISSQDVYLHRIHPPKPGKFNLGKKLVESWWEHLGRPTSSSLLQLSTSVSCFCLNEVDALDTRTNIIHKKHTTEKV